MSIKRKWDPKIEHELDVFLLDNPCVYFAGHSWEPKSVDYPLHTVAGQGKNAFVRYLIQDKGTRVDSRCPHGKPPLIYAADGEHLSTVRLLLELGADINACDDLGEDALFRAMVNLDYTMTRMLLDQGATLTADRLKQPRSWRVQNFIANILMERSFSTVIVGGICSNGEFRDFLAEGVCDARLLIHIAKFAYF